MKRLILKLKAKRQMKKWNAYAEEAKTVAEKAGQLSMYSEGLLRGAGLIK